MAPYDLYDGSFVLETETIGRSSHGPTTTTKACIYVYVYVCVYVYVSVYVYVYVCAYIYIYIHITHLFIYSEP